MNRERILVIDDEPLICKGCVMVLTDPHLRGLPRFRVLEEAVGIGGRVRLQLGARHGDQEQPRQQDGRTADHVLRMARLSRLVKPSPCARA